MLATLRWGFRPLILDGLVLTELHFCRSPHIYGIDSKKSNLSFFTSFLIKSCPSERPISEAFVHAIHRFKEIIFLIPLLKKIQLTPFLLQLGYSHSEETNRPRMGDRFKDLEGLFEDFVAAHHPFGKGLLF